MGNAVRCFSLFSNQAPFYSSQVLQPSRCLSLPLNLNQSAHLSYRPYLSLAYWFQRPAVSLTGHSLVLLEGTAQNSVARSNCAVKTLCLLPPPPTFVINTTPVPSSILDPFSTRQKPLAIVAIITKNNCGVDQTFRSLLVPKFQLGKTKLHATAPTTFNQPLTSSLFYNTHLFLCSMGSC